MNTKNKTCYLKFRVTENEKNEFKRLLKKHEFGSISKFFRVQIDSLKKKPLPPKIKSKEQIIEHVAELLNSQIAKIGTNINKFTRKANNVHGGSDLVILEKSILHSRMMLRICCGLRLRILENISHRCNGK